MNLKFCKFIALILLLGNLILLGSCRTLFVNNPEKKAATAQKKEEREFQKNYNAIVKAHYKHQDKKTRKRMKKNLRKANKNKEKKKDGWECR